jgi:NTP pyrophosphatase (non-canonical NTP hydrolase)
MVSIKKFPKIRTIQTDPRVGVLCEFFAPEQPEILVFSNLPRQSLGVLNPDLKIKEHQEWVKEAWKKSPKKQVSERDELLFLMEEVGEMAEAIRKMSGNKENKDIKTDIEKELGDIFLSLLTLAIRYNVDLESAFEKTKQSILKRYMDG